VQIYQDRAGHALFRIKPQGGKVTDADLNSLTQGTRQYLGAAARVDWEVVDDLPGEPSGKFLFCRSTVAPHFLEARAA
jgi:hypothetical protein